MTSNDHGAGPTTVLVTDTDASLLLVRDAAQLLALRHGDRDAQRRIDIDDRIADRHAVDSDVHAGQAHRLEAGSDVALRHGDNAGDHHDRLRDERLSDAWRGGGDADRLSCLRVNDVELEDAETAGAELLDRHSGRRDVRHGARHDSAGLGDEGSRAASAVDGAVLPAAWRGLGDGVRDAWDQVRPDRHGPRRTPSWSASSRCRRLGRGCREPATSSATSRARPSVSTTPTPLLVRGDTTNPSPKPA